MRAAAVNAYLRAAADALGLKDWRITFDPQPTTEEDTYAEIDATEDRHASVQLCATFATLPARQQREIIVHELCHLHTTRLRTIAEDLAASESTGTKSFILKTIENADEHAVESFAQLLAPQLPLPAFSRAPRVSRPASRARTRA